MTTRRPTPAEVTDQQAGGAHLGPGLWMDRRGHLHVSIPDLIEAFGLEDTPDERAKVEQIVRDAWARSSPDAIIVRQELAGED